MLSLLVNSSDASFDKNILISEHGMKGNPKSHVAHVKL